MVSGCCNGWKSPLWCFVLFRLTRVVRCPWHCPVFHVSIHAMRPCFVHLLPLCVVSLLSLLSLLSLCPRSPRSPRLCFLIVFKDPKTPFPVNSIPNELLLVIFSNLDYKCKTNLTHTERQTKQHQKTTHARTTRDNRRTKDEKRRRRNEHRRHATVRPQQTKKQQTTTQTIF